MFDYEACIYHQMIEDWKRNLSNFKHENLINQILINAMLTGLLV
ncbi:hypothetical protein SLGD_00385 [Staphylococcus lugdunensis HKU09-01]|nr:hypothetical protein SLGD_00385 [Staphylococcus lugdunensis HKU09-01]CCB52808.1 hypothetical protein SLUG_03800 [Staphylococcus lugdunensis N920143]